MKSIWFLFCIMMLSAPAAGSSFNHEHTRWDELVKNHVRWINSGSASQVDYKGFNNDRAELQLYLKELSSVSKSEFDGWNKNQRLAFLINAYNSFTIELILTEYPDLDSIKDLGSLFKSPWEKKFFSLLGKERDLDWIEHDMIRKPGAYDDPRIHAAVNCASVGCPALRNEAFVARKLDHQLEDSLQRFLKDRSRNRLNTETGKLEVSKIFDWYGDDFRKGYKGYDSLEGFFGSYAGLLADDPAGRKNIETAKAAITFLDYDWRLNDIR